VVASAIFRWTFHSGSTEELRMRDGEETSPEERTKQGDLAARYAEETSAYKRDSGGFIVKIRDLISLA
jgi:hypothetical protein